MYPGPDDPLRIAYLSYRGKPHVGGQGVYTRHLTKALVDLGHHVEVLGGQPYPVLDERVQLTEAPQPRHLQRPLPRPLPRLLGDPAPGRRGRDPPVLDRDLQRAPGVQRPRLAGPEAAAARLRPRARQPEPRLRPARHRAAPADHRHAPPPDHRRPAPGDGARPDQAQADQRRPLVLLRQDAGPGRPADAPHRRRERELHQGHPRRHGRRHGAHAPRAGGGRPRAVPAPARDRPRARAG